MEIRTRTETRWHYVTHYRDEERTGYRLVNGHLESYTYTVSVPYEVYEPYEVEVEYEYKILNTTLTNNGISAAVSALNLTQDQMERYTLLLETRGNKPDIFGDNVYANPGVSEEYERYAVPGEYLTNQQFSNMHREAEKYLGYPYVWGGSSPGTSFDCSGFVSYVINNCGNGWNYGRLTANGWKNATARVAASDVKPGDLVFFQGTYNTAGASHVGIVVDPVNKIMIHCGNPIQYASYDTPYWRHMPIAMEESSNYKCSEKSPKWWLFAVTKERRALMYAKLDKLREDLKKAVAKREAADAKVKQLEAKLKEEENQQIVSDVASYNLSPEQLAQFLQLANSGRLQEMLSGQVPMPGAVNADTSGKKPDEDNETDMDKEEEDFLDEENE